MWGLNLENPGPPFLKVTKYGRESLMAGEPNPHDPDGYMAYLKKEIPHFDETILTYATESLQAYLAGLMFSSAIMLGGASEKAFLLLLHSYANSISDPERKKKFEKDCSGGIKRKLDAFGAQVPYFRSGLPPEVNDDLDIQLDGIFNLIRNCRYDAGHPTGRQMERQLAYANLRLFIPYCKRVCDLIGYFQTHQI